MEDSKRDRRVLAVSSLPAVGSAGLKNIIGVLGTSVIPVPSLLISGLGNMAGHKRFELPFAELLREAFHMSEQQGFELVLYTGYLQAADQVDDLLAMVNEYKALIHAVVVDPVCGDRGRAYVSEEIIDRLRSLLEIADVAVPNSTELALIQGKRVAEDLNSLIGALSVRYPQMELITTGVVLEQEIANYLTYRGVTTVLRHPLQVGPFVVRDGRPFCGFFYLLPIPEGSEFIRSGAGSGRQDSHADRK